MRRGPGGPGIGMEMGPSGGPGRMNSQVPLHMQMINARSQGMGNPASGPMQMGGGPG